MRYLFCTSSLDSVACWRCSGQGRKRLPSGTLRTNNLVMGHSMNRMAFTSLDILRGNCAPILSLFYYVNEVPYILHGKFNKSDWFYINKELK